jgi:hypothetical protein
LSCRRAPEIKRSAQPGVQDGTKAPRMLAGQPHGRG